MRAAVPILVALLLSVAACGSNGDEDAMTAAAETQAADAVFAEYEREVTQEDIERTADKRVEGPGQEAPAPGTYRLVVNEGVMQVFLPDGFQISQELTVKEDTWRIERYIGGEGVFCADDGPSTYTWKLEGEELTLAPKSDACADRDSILTGAWTKTR